MQVNTKMNAQSHAGLSPARQARAAIEVWPELGEMKFGNLVSRIARGQELPPESSPSAATATDL